MRNWTLTTIDYRRRRWSMTESLQNFNKEKIAHIPFSVTEVHTSLVLTLAVVWKKLFRRMLLQNWCLVQKLLHKCSNCFPCVFSFGGRYVKGLWIFLISKKCSSEVEHFTWKFFAPGPDQQLLIGAGWNNECKSSSTKSHLQESSSISSTSDSGKAVVWANKRGFPPEVCCVSVEKENQCLPHWEQNTRGEWEGSFLWKLMLLVRKMVVGRVQEVYPSQVFHGVLPVKHSSIFCHYFFRLFLSVV